MDICNVVAVFVITTKFIIELSFPAGTLVIDADIERKEFLVPKELKTSWIPTSTKAMGIGSFGLGIEAPHLTYALLLDPAWELLGEVPVTSGVSGTSLSLNWGESYRYLSCEKTPP